MNKMSNRLLRVAKNLKSSVFIPNKLEITLGGGNRNSSKFVLDYKEWYTISGGASLKGLSDMFADFDNGFYTKLKKSGIGSLNIDHKNPAIMYIGNRTDIFMYCRSYISFRDEKSMESAVEMLKKNNRYVKDERD